MKNGLFFMGTSDSEELALHGDLCVITRLVIRSEKILFYKLCRLFIGAKLISVGKKTSCERSLLARASALFYF